MDMGTGTAPGRIPPPQQPEETPAQIADHQPAAIRGPAQVSPNILERARTLASAAWRSLPSYLAFYLLVLVTGFAAWQGRKPVTVIAPFQVPDKASLPFGGDTVANVLQDRLAQIHDEIERQKNDRYLHATDMHSLGQPGLQIPPHHALFRRAEVPTRFAVEVKGLSYQGLIGVARAVMVSGDLILESENGGNFILIARTSHGGPWQSKPHPRTAEGLSHASWDLAEEILESIEPAVAGVVFLNQGQVERALASLKKASEREPNDVAAKLALCEGTEANEFYREAMTCYEGALRMSPGSPEEVEERLAQAQWLYGEHGNRDLALQKFEELAHSRHYSRALLGLGKALDDTGEHERALSVYKEFLSQASDPPSRAIAYVGRATALAKMGQHKAALAEFQTALDTLPGDSLVLVHRGVELADAGDLDAGITELRSVVEGKENADLVPFASFQLGGLLNKKGDWEKASEQFRAAVERRPDYSEAHNALAESLTRQGRIVEARSEFGETAKLSSMPVDRKYAEVLANEWLGNTLQALCIYPGAASAYQEAIRLKPDYRIAHSELGHVFQQQGHVARAVQEFQKALDANPNELDNDEWFLMTYVRLGEALVSEGQPYATEGLADLRAAVMMDPKRGESLVSLGKALYEEGDYLEAASIFSKANSNNKDDVEAHFGLALSLYKQGRQQDATAQSRPLIDFGPTIPRIVCVLNRAQGSAAFPLVWQSNRTSTFSATSGLGPYGRDVARYEKRTFICKTGTGAPGSCVRGWNRVRIVECLATWRTNRSIR
jgi:tetratricopeptide (TPR) repeat protein